MANAPETLARPTGRWLAVIKTWPVSLACLKTGSSNRGRSRLAGVGKSALLAGFAEEAGHRRALAVTVDCTVVGSRERGLVQDWGGTFVARLEDIKALHQAVAAIPSVAVLRFDSVESWSQLTACLKSFRRWAIHKC